MKKLTFLILLNLLLLNAFPQTIESDNSEVRDAYNLAVNTVKINVRKGVLAAGADYGGEWTRDIAINTWNGVSLILPDVAEKSLWSVTINKDTIGHQYWDKIIWTIAALNHYYVTGNYEFLKQAYKCSENTIYELEEFAFDKKYGLFTGPAVFADGIAAYPEPVYDKTNYSSYVLDHKNSEGIKCLSTNCTYYGAYKALAEMAVLLKKDEKVIEAYRSKAEKLKRSILKNFYNESENTLNYMIDGSGEVHKYQESVGYSYAVIFGVLDSAQAYQLADHAKTSRFGIPTLYPDLPRYSAEHPGRHNNLVWPMTNGFFAQAAKIAGNYKAYNKELFGLTSLALDEDKGNYEFWEIFDPITGKPEGGYQDAGAEYPDQHWKSCRLQTWSATAYINMVHFGLAGIEFTDEGIAFSPYLPKEISYLKLTDLTYTNSSLNVVISGTGDQIKGFYVNGIKKEKHVVPFDTTGPINVFIQL